jgi:hypothetical protein
VAGDGFKSCRSDHFIFPSARWRNFSSLRKLQQAFLPRRFGRNLIFSNKIRLFYAFSRRKIPLGIAIA